MTHHKLDGACRIGQQQWSTRAIPDRDLFYVAHPVRSIRRRHDCRYSLAADTAATITNRSCIVSGLRYTVFCLRLIGKPSLFKAQRNENAPRLFWSQCAAHRRTTGAYSGAIRNEGDGRRTRAFVVSAGVMSALAIG